MDLSGLRIFTAVVRAGGVTRAAERLHRVQSNVTTRIRQLEEELGVSLFIRNGKRLHLAPAGQVLLDYADRLLALADEARDAVQDSRPRGVLRLGAMESTAAIRLPGPLAEYHRRYPAVLLELRTGNPQQLATLSSMQPWWPNRSSMGRSSMRPHSWKNLSLSGSPVTRPLARPVACREQWSPLNVAVRIANGWRIGTPVAARCRNARLSSAPITPCWAALRLAWALPCCQEAF